MYGLIANNAYVLPTRDDVIRHRVVITTLAMSQHLLELQLSHGFFTHILIDEAAQALEPEALMPLALAGPNTKVVFTGDHMQVGIELQHNQFRFFLFCSALFSFVALVPFNHELSCLLSIARTRIPYFTRGIRGKRPLSIYLNSACWGGQDDRNKRNE